MTFEGSPPEFLDKNQLRNAVSLAAVAARLGTLVDESGYGACPFHDDERPSFNVFLDGSGVERWGCYPCGLRGDVYDLLRLRLCLTFPQAIEWVEERLGELPPPPPRQKRSAFASEDCAVLVHDAQERALSDGCCGWIAATAGLRIGDDVQADEHLRSHWRWGVDPSGAVVMPHYDAQGVLTGCKFRSVDGTKWAYPGSAFHALYGAWRRRLHLDVVLCEGETDAAWASLSRPAADVLALPAGAGRFLDVWSALEADVYWLAFDADDAGRAADATWRRALEGRDVRTIEVPEGLDLKAAGVNVGVAIRS